MGKGASSRTLNPTKITVGTGKSTDTAANSDVKTPSPSEVGTDAPAQERKPRTIYGNLLETPEAEAVCLRLGMTRGDLLHLRRHFDDEDGTHSDTVTLRSFFHLVSDGCRTEKCHAFTMELLRLADLDATVKRITFDQYVRMICTFATFPEPQLWHFFYRVYSSGGLEMEVKEAQRLGDNLKAAGSSYARNIQVATQRLAASTIPPMEGDPVSLRFAEFLQLVRRHPVAFHPVVQLQINVRRSTLGERYWERKTCEQALIPGLLKHLRLHRGSLPRRSVKQWVLDTLFSRKTTTARARTLAKQLYKQEFVRLEQ